MIYGFWLGDKDISELSAKCIATWPKDYYKIYRTVEEIESDFPEIKSYPYFYQALEAKHVVAASDLFRLISINKSGGIYLDTDVEILNLDKLLELEAKAKVEGRLAIGYEDEKNFCAAVLVAGQNSFVVTRLLDYYRRTPFSETYPKKNISTAIFTKIINQYKDNAIRMPEKSFFQWRWNEAISDEEKKLRQSDKNAIVTHHWEGSWL